MSTAAKPLPPHGSLSRHKYHGCKCDTCREGYRNYQRSRYRKQGYGTWQPYVDAEPVRQHLLQLRAAGFSYDRIAKTAGLYTAAVTAFVYDLGPKRHRRQRTTPGMAAKILAVTDDSMTPGMVDPTGTRRRIQALTAIGWPMRCLAPHIGVAQATVSRLCTQRYVFGHTAEAVASCYERLRDTDPQRYGVPAWLVTKSRNWAKREGWPDPVWWEDMGGIDDPDFDPADAERELGRNELASFRRAEVEHLASFGCSPEEIHARLGDEIALSTIRAIVREHQTGQRRDRRQAAA